MAEQLKNRNEMSKEYTWRLDHIYENDSLWEADHERVERMAEGVKAYQGKLAESAEVLEAAIKGVMEMSRAYEKVSVYAHMKSHEDSGESKYQGFASKADSLESTVEAASAFLAPEILAIPDEKLQGFIQSSAGLQFYRKYIDEICRSKPHVLSTKEEMLLAKAREVAGGPSNIYNMLNNADITFPDIRDSAGHEVQVTKGRFVLLLENEDREVRKAAFSSFYSSYEKQKNTLGALLYSNVKGNIFFAESRRFNSAREAALFDSNVDMAVYDNLITVVRKKLPLLHRYMKLRKKVMGLSELHMYDLYTPMVKAQSVVIPYPEAVEKVKQGLARMGETYLKDMEQAFQGGWIDVYENKGKRSGAYSWGCYDSHPYILLNHSDNINNMFTLAHELGHAMHSYYSDRTQPYAYAQYKIFVAEVASTCNEALLMNHLLGGTRETQMKLQLMNYFMEQFRSTVYRQTMFAEFEKEIHERAECGEALTAELLSEIYLELNRAYYGPDVVMDPEIAMEWSRIPHFYNSFYVYQYATGFSAAMALSKAIIDVQEGALERYLEFLGSGGSDHPVELLKKAGVDMSTPAPVENALSVFEALLEEMEGLL